MNWLIVILNFLHLIATVIWIGGAAFIVLFLDPVIRKSKSTNWGSTKFHTDLGRRFMNAVWISIALLFINGLGMAYIPNSSTNPLWTTIMLIKHIFVIGMVIAAVYQEMTLRKMRKIKSKEIPSKGLKNLLKRHHTVNVYGGTIAFILGIIVLLLTVMAQAA